MGIFNKILKKKERPEEGSQKSKTQVRKKAVRKEPQHVPSRGIDILAPSQEIESAGIEPPLAEVIPHEKGEKSQLMDEQSPQFEEPPMVSRKIPPPPIEREKIPSQKKGSPPTLKDKIGNAETKFAETEAAITEFSVKFQKLGTTFAPLKILVFEGKINLAEANIKLAEAEIDPQNVDLKWGEIEGKIAEAETKITEAERTVSTLIPENVEAGSILGEIKIKLAGAKIALAEVKIELVQGRLSPNSLRPSSEEYTEAIEAPPEIPKRSNDKGPSHLSKIDSVSQAQSSKVDENLASDISNIAQEKVKITSELVDTSLEDVGKSTEKVEIDAQDSRVLEGKPEPKEKVVMEGVGESPSPFETGIDLKKVSVATNEQDTIGASTTTQQQKVTIKSDERESAWVAADGTLKNAPSREGVQEKPPDDDTHPRITFRQSEIEKRLVTEDLNKKGIELRKIGQWEEAIATFDRVLEIDPENEAAWHNKGVALRTSGRYEESLTCFDHVLRNKTDNPIVWFNKSFVLSKLGKFEEALAAFDEVIALQSNHAAAWYNRGKILEILGRHDEAEKSIQRAKELGY